MVWYISEEKNSTDYCYYDFLICAPFGYNSRIMIDDDFQKYMIDLNDG